MRQEKPENGRISGTSQVYLLLREKEIPAFSTIQGKTVMQELLNFERKNSYVNRTQQGTRSSVSASP
jgi:hypothetical protein